MESIVNVFVKSDSVAVIFFYYVVYIICSLYSIKNLDKTFFKPLIISLVVFLLIYFPILEYWSIWFDEISFWPEGFYPYSRSVIESPLLPDYSFYQMVYNSCFIISMTALFSAKLTFIHEVNRKTNQKRLLVINYIPLLNLFSIPFSIYRFSKADWVKDTVLATWITSVILYVFYIKLAPLLALFGLDLLNPLTKIIWNEDPNSFKWEDEFTNPTGYSFTMLFDIVNIVRPAFLFIDVCFQLAVAYLFLNYKKQHEI